MQRASEAGDLAGTGHDGGEGPLVPVRVDGKTVRGARNADGSQVHLLAALAGERGVVAAQTEAGAKTNEVPMIIPLPGGLSLDGAVVTADALHTQRATADYVHGRGADFAFPVKDNQPGLFDVLDALPWQDVPVAPAATDRGHGRGHHPHHPGPRRASGLAVPARQPGIPDRAPCHRPGRHAPVRGRRARHHQPRRQARQPRRPSPALSVASGRLSLCTGSATPFTAKMTQPSAPARGHGPWPPSGTSQSAHYIRPGGMTPPKPPAGPVVTWNGHSPFSDSRHDLETAVAQDPADLHVVVPDLR